MKGKDFLKLQIGMYITDAKDINDPANYCLILEFRGTQMRLQPYERPGVPQNAHPFWIDYRDVNVTEKLYASEYTML